MSVVLGSVLIISLISLLFGFGLALAARKLAVKVDERVLALEDALPGVNCGACGYAGCADYANSLVFEDAAVDLCAPGGPEVQKSIAGITGKEGEEREPLIASVLCLGGDWEAPKSQVYQGIRTCAAANLTGGGKDCVYGCMGFGDCTAVCKFDAIRMNANGLPEVDEEKCTGCRLCARACPRGVIGMVPRSAYFTVRCRSRDKGPAVLKVCKVGCIGCGICVKLNNSEGIALKDNLAVVDHAVFRGDAAGAEKCPKKTIEFRKDKYEARTGSVRP